MDGTRKYAWYTGRGNTRPVLFFALATYKPLTRLAFPRTSRESTRSSIWRINLPVSCFLSPKP